MGPAIAVYGAPLCAQEESAGASVGALVSWALKAAGKGDDRRKKSEEQLRVRYCG